MARAVRVLTAYTTGTKTGTAPKNDTQSSKKTDAVIVVKKDLTTWRPQREPFGWWKPRRRFSCPCAASFQRLKVGLRSEDHEEAFLAVRPAHPASAC